GYGYALRIRDARWRNRKVDGGRLSTAVAEIFVRMPHTPQDGSVANERSPARPWETPGYRLPIPGHRRQPVREGAVDVRGEVVTHDQHHGDRDQEVQRG